MPAQDLPPVSEQLSKSAFLGVWQRRRVLQAELAVFRLLMTGDLRTKASLTLGSEVSALETLTLARRGRIKFLTRLQFAVLNYLMTRV